MILKSTRKFQAGGTMSAKTEYVPMNFEWEDPSNKMKSQKSLASTPVLEGQYDKYSNYKLSGLENDKQNLYTEIESLKSKMKSGLSPTYTREAYDNDAKRLQNLMSVGIPDLAQKEARYKEVVSSSTPARGELAINRDQAFVKDRTTGKFDLVTVDDLLTKKVTKGGTLMSRYEPQTVGTALEARAGDAEFTGRRGGKGEALENMLHSIQSTKDLTTQLKAAFTGIGTTTDKDTGLTTIGDAPVGELFNFLSDKMGVPAEAAGGQRAIESETKKSNIGQLTSAYNMLKGTLQSSGTDEVLKRSAIVSYLQEYAGKPEAPDYNQYIKKKVEEQLNNAMMSHLTESYGNSIQLKGTAGAAGGSTGEEVADKSELNPITAAIAGPLVTDEWTPGDDVHKTGDKKLARSLPVTSSEFKGNELLTYNGFKNADANKYPKTAQYNTVMTNLAAGHDLSKNLFLGNVSNTPLNKLSNGSGLSRAVLMPGTNQTIYHDIPVIFNKQTGQFGIAWDVMNSGIHKTAVDNAIANKKTNPAGEKAGPVFEAALEKEYDTLAARDEDIRKMGKITIRKAIKYDMIVPDDPKTFFGGTSEAAEEYKSMVGESTKVTDAGVKEYYKGLTQADDLAIKMKTSDDLFKVPVFSILSTNKELATLAANYYPSNKVSASELERLNRESIVRTISQ